MSNGDDFADQADALIEREREAGVARVRAAAAIKTVATGKCFYCDEDVGEGRRFCDKFCADGFEREAAARKRNGQS